MTNPTNIKPVIKDTSFSGQQFLIKVNTVPIDLTNAIVKMSLKQKPSDAIPVKTFTSEDGSMSIDSNPLTGIFTLNPQFITIPAFDYHYDVKIFLNNGTEKIYVWGKWKIIQNVTE